MADIASILKSEITRLARKELRVMARALKQSGTHARAEIARLKQRAAALEKEVARLQKQLGRTAAVPAEPEEAQGPHRRFTAKGFKSLRERLELSGADMARLLGVSLQSVYKWESGSTRPRAAQLQAIAALRGLGKKAVRARLDPE
ncbi:MAG: helix-turn-helix domain-containing protein [Betaproteobacteria bacterium]|nr:helix-turn-helix domain-containing protein [Betaproteobacteria bacterium]